MDSKPKSQAESKEAGAPIVVDYMRNKYNQYEKDKDLTKVGLSSVVREPKKLDFSWDKVVDEKKKDSSGPVLKEQDILAFLMTASGNESGKSQYLNLVETAGKNPNSSSSKSNVEVAENITKDMTKNVRSMFEKGEASNNATKMPSKRISLIEDSTETNSIFESTPIARSDDVIKSGETVNEEDQVQKGITKNLLDQWQKKGEDKTIIVSTNKPLIKLVDGNEDSIKERINYRDEEENSLEKVPESDVIQKGITKSLLNQWNNQTIESNHKPTKKIIQIGELDQTNVENIHNANYDEEQTTEKNVSTEVSIVQKGTAKSLLDQWNDKKNQTYTAPKKTIVMVEPMAKDSIEATTNSGLGAKIKLDTNHSPTPGTNTISSKSDTAPDHTNKIEINTTASQINDHSAQDIPPQIEEVKEEEVDLDSLQKGLAKAMVLQWKSDHPDESLDDIIQNATKTTGTYNESLIEKGIDKTLYDQWKYVKFKHLPKLVRSKKPLVINIPEKRTRPTVMQVLANKANEEASASAVSDNKSETQLTHNNNIIEELKGSTSEKLSNSENLQTKFNDIKGLPEFATSTTDGKVDVDKFDKDKLFENKVNEKKMDRNVESPISDKDNVINENVQQKSPSNSLPSDETHISMSEVENSVVKASDHPNIDKIEKGFAKNALEQLKQTVESSKTFEKKSVLILQDDGKISENEPKMSEIMNQNSETIDSLPVVQQGMTKQLLGQWQNKKNETFQYSKKRIIVDEDEGAIAESEPVVRKDVVKSNEESAKDIVEKGMTKNIMNQLLEGSKNKDISKSYNIVIAETDGVVCENEPLNRNDVAKEDDQLSSASCVVQQGTTKNLLGQWNKITTEPSEKFKKEPLNLVLDSGHVSENEPIKRTDVVSSEPAQYDEIEQIEKGFTKSLLNQWQNQSSASNVAKAKTRVEIREEDGSVSENIPQTLENVARESETIEQNKPNVQTGIAKNLVGQWQSKKLDNFKIEKNPIVIADEEGQSAENEPIERSGVIRSDQVTEETVIEKGYTKNILNQWQNIPLKSATPINKTPITISEQDGSIAENEPIQRTDVVKSGADSNAEESVVQKGFTKSLLNQWHEKKETSTNQNLRKKIEIKEEDGQCVENEPSIRSDVVRSTDINNVDEICIGKGFTSNMLNQWQQNTTDRSSGSASRDKTPIIISHGDGKVAENVPVHRDDVAREGDSDTNAIHVVQQGTAKQLKGQWQNIGNKTYEKDNKTPILISEDDGRVAESQPIERTDVVKGDQLTDTDNVSFLATGLTKSLVGHWKNKQTEEFIPEKKPIQIMKDDGHVVENEPIKRDDVVKEDSSNENTSVVLKGTTKGLLNRWKNPELVQKPSPKTVVQISKDDGVVAENEPTVRDDIVKADMPTENDKIVQKGIAKTLTSQWNTGSVNKSMSKEDKKIILELDSGHVVENDPSPKRTDVYREENEGGNTSEQMPMKGQANLIKQKLISAGQYTMQSSRKEPIQIFNSNPDERSVVENEPIKREGVAREDDDNNDEEVIVLKKGYAKNMVGFWAKSKNESDQSFKKQPILEFAEGPAIFENDPQPSLKNEIKPILDAGVFENEPVTRQDVAREADFQPEVISAHATRNVRKLWSQKEAESANPVVKTKKPEQVRFTPPREKSPPSEIKEEFKSTHTLTLTNSTNS